MATVQNVHDAYVPQSARDNYSQAAIEMAEAEGITPKAAMKKLAATFAKRHETDKTAGWEHLAAWAKDHDPTPPDGIDAGNFALSRAVETARRDPTSVLQAHEAVVQAAVEVLKGEDGSGAVSAAVTES